MKKVIEMALEGIRRYGLDTLSGRVDGPDDRDWQRAGVNEMTKRARLGTTALEKALEEKPAPTPQGPVAWVTVERGFCASIQSADFRHIADGQHQLYVGPLQNDVVAAIETLKSLGYTYTDDPACLEGKQWVAPQPPAQPTYKDSTPHLHVGDSSFESWFSEYYIINDMINPKQVARDAYAAGMGDPLVVAAPQPPAKQEPVEQLQISREQWINEAMRVYLISGDAEAEALDLATYLWGEQDTNDLNDPIEAAMDDVEGRPDRQPAQQQEPVAIVDANDEGSWAGILSDRNVKVGQLPFTTPQPPAQQEPVTTTCRDSFLSGYEAAQADAKVCDLPPHGWHCTRNAGHDGPCAAVETDDHELVARAMTRLAEQPPVQQEPKQKLMEDLTNVAGYFYDGPVRNQSVVDACEKAINEISGKEIFKPSIVANDGGVICPACTYQFRAIPDDVQKLMPPPNPPTESRSNT